MIRPLRQCHRYLLVVLSVFLPAALVVGLAARRPVPVASELPPSLTAIPTVSESVVWKRTDLFTKAPVEVQLLNEQEGMGPFAIHFSAPGDFIKPDLIVYWIAGDPGIIDTLPGNAVLLGAFHSSALPVSDEMAKTNGVLVLYSLADNEVVDISKPFVVADVNRRSGTHTSSANSLSRLR
jgi:hypothetical protein